MNSIRTIALSFISFSVMMHISCALPETAYLLRAISEGDFAKVKLALKQNPASMRERDVDGNGPLHTACSSADTQDDPSILWYLLDNGADAHLKNNFLETPLHQTIYMSNTDKRMIYISTLVKHGTDINARDFQGNSVLDKFVIERNQQASGLFLNCFTDILSPDIVPRAKELAGSQAGKGFGFTDIYEELSQKRLLRFSMQGYNECTGLTKLMYAVLLGDANKVEQLLKSGEAINQQSDDQWGYSALDMAVMQNRLPMVQLLIKRGASIDQRNKRGQNALNLVESIDNQILKKRMIEMLLSKNK